MRLFSDNMDRKNSFTPQQPNAKTINYGQSAKSSSDKRQKFLAESTTEDVLLHFCAKLGEARRRYRRLIKTRKKQCGNIFSKFSN